MQSKFVNRLPSDISSMRVSLGSDRLVSNAHTCNPSRLRYANVVRPSQERSVCRHSCTCSAAASPSGATGEEQQVNKLGRIRQATRAAKRAYRFCFTQARRLKSCHLNDRSHFHTAKQCSGNLRYSCNVTLTSASQQQQRIALQGTCSTNMATMCWCTGALDQLISSVCYWALQCYLAGALLTLARTMSSWQASGVGF